MKGSAYGAGARVELLDHAFDLLADAQLININTEYFCVGIQLLQAAKVLLAFLHFQTGNDGLQLNKERIGAARKGFTGIAIAHTASDVISALIGLFACLWQYRKLKIQLLTPDQHSSVQIK